ncbi:hypothetical protein HN371_28370 [Candidatus Poribacteria bacterium]|jgi:ankyrin repeat protein|nr:hypothetical protein [Candidatus Poribacteria bacterium]MBT5532199.1 hypothetical protein [Candidatus Poribacteria bacterium]MBT5710764.1 hypothetical protein [Candidatus Poribacteria bacterium]MBT7100420.1 hypothetical protein [Candidatus Poribacteria bacterium]MBT7806886.1 hypothetical protein [Candidatus Poribacteria bacterium]
MSRLPLRASLERLKNEAKTLHKDYRASDADALETIRQVHPRFREAANAVIRAAALPLGEMQHVVALRYGFETWAALKQAVEVDASVSGDPTPGTLRDHFVRAVAQGDPDDVRRLLKHAHVRSNIDAPWFRDMTALQRAVANAGDMVGGGHLGVVAVLLDEGADVEVAGPYGATPLQIVARKFSYFADDALARHVVERGATVDIHSAVGLELMDCVRALVAADPDAIHAVARNGRTPLHYAHTTDMTDFLLYHGADIDSRDTERHSSPAQWALFHSHAEQRDWTELAQHYVDRGAEADFLLLCALDDRERVEARLAAEPTLVNRRFDFSDAPHAYHMAKVGWWRNSPIDAIQAAVNYDRHDLLGRLIEAGGEFTLEHWNMVFPKGDRGLDACLAVLLSSGMDVDAPASSLDGETIPPLLHCARSEGLQTRENLIDGVAAQVVVFVRRGADPGVRDSAGRTALHHAAANPYGREAIAMLAQHGADPRARDDAGATPLDRATEGGWEDNVRVLTDLTTDG